ncbi:Hsp20/alpha crystallin family protein [Lolliginicoccus suaedae]|uniref:Hsp20/alpha crystallin family protein n=1 Tax=Lolliginicoccus suaedae TaxID=2605429 RepID=UPI0011EE8AA0|nr:Hsp20/alpha crystallin family protein [Lolliginicoccus suaedae]
MALPARRAAATPALGRWDPFRDFEEIYDRLGRWLDTTPGDAPSAWVPNVDIEETGTAYQVEAELPGVSKDNIAIEYRDGVLHISGEVEEKERDGIVHRRTRRTGRFSYQVSLPTEIDHDNIGAQLNDGVLAVTLPKSEKRDNARKIEITG